ncbi:unnamed protein product [Nesidiocoris tenuis]|uniref:Uncharacterized protein n=1 Tax=Nesidiocoris tenuis TaxID=355587 RepID=A0A6H5FZI7_9HEMI|nr:unnamed protein product [Nesidiocoris tenuis]
MTRPEDRSFPGHSRRRLYRIPAYAYFEHKARGCDQDAIFAEIIIDYNSRGNNRIVAVEELVHVFTRMACLCIGLIMFWEYQEHVVSNKSLFVVSAESLILFSYLRKKEVKLVPSQRTTPRVHSRQPRSTKLVDEFVLKTTSRAPAAQTVEQQNLAVTTPYLGKNTGMYTHPPLIYEDRCPPRNARALRHSSAIRCASPMLPIHHRSHRAHTFPSSALRSANHLARTTRTLRSRPIPKIKISNLPDY